ncbi:transmembrane protein [Rhynchospora pubera]|uniref:Transmembrane protein n=1 Tax=Rhynchospora pubera TaxID=906938 RepID=A0AAV8ES82_9POAL|nr:transmembrane protein [Rhynchospora pubera]
MYYHPSTPTHPPQHQANTNEVYLKLLQYRKSHLVAMASTMSGAMTTPVPEHENSVPVPIHHTSSSIGPFFGVLAAILVLTMLSCIIGQVCSAHAEGPDSRYDCTVWARRRCWGCVPRRGIFRDAKSAVAAEAETDKHPPLALPQP